MSSDVILYLKLKKFQGNGWRNLKNPEKIKDQEICSYSFLSMTGKLHLGNLNNLIPKDGLKNSNSSLPCHSGKVKHWKT